MIEAVIFDFDGLIYDTETPEYESWAALYQAYGAELHLDTWSAWVGRDAREFDPVGHLETHIGSRIDKAVAVELRRRHFDELIRDSDLRAGVRDYLAEARTLGLKIGLASSASRDWVVPHLQQFGILEYFDCIRVRDDVLACKPDPELYLQAVSCLDACPSKSLAFEDSPHGAQAAKAAGLRCVVVPNDLTRRLTFPPVDLRLDSMAEVTLTQVFDRLSENSDPICEPT